MTCLLSLCAFTRADDQAQAPQVQRGAMVISSSDKGVVYQLRYDVYAAIEAFAKSITSGSSAGDTHTQSGQETAAMFEEMVKSGSFRILAYQSNHSA